MKRSGVPRLAAALALAGSLAASVPGRLASGQPGADGRIGSLTALAAADSADRLMNAGRDYEALPYIARVEQVAGEVDAEFLIRAAVAENNAGFQIRAVKGLAIPVTRSSVERVELANRSLLRLDRAERRNTGPGQRSRIVAARGRELAVWGFAREGYAEYRRAHQVHPLDLATLRDVRWLELALRPGAEAGGR